MFFRGPIRNFSVARVSSHHHNLDWYMPRAHQQSLLCISHQGGRSGQSLRPTLPSSWAPVGGGLRAAIAIAEANPIPGIALISKVYPMRSHTVAAEGGAAGVVRDDDSLENHFNDTVSGGGDWLCEQDVSAKLCQTAPKSWCSWNTGVARGAASPMAR